MDYSDMDYFEIIKMCPLFESISKSQLNSLLKCISAVEKSYEKNSFIFREDDTANSVGVVLSGVVYVFKEDFWGKRNILARIGPGELFGEAFSCAEADRLTINVSAVENSTVLMIDYKKIITTCSFACTFHTILIKNMLKILAKKNIMLTQKIEHITKNSTREKLLSYLSSKALQAESRIFTIPFNRQELADYLSVERSAMSAELCRMRDEGIISFHKNQFELYSN